MARRQYPSDEARKRQKPHVKVHLSIANHPTYGHVFADPLLRGVIVGIWVIAARAHISATNDELTLTTADIEWITGKDRMVDAANCLRRACVAAAYPLRAVCALHADCPRRTCARPARWVIQVRNFSRKQGFTPHTPAETPHNSAPSEEPKNQRTDITHSATPPLPIESDKPIHSLRLTSVNGGGSKNVPAKQVLDLPAQRKPIASRNPDPRIQPFFDFWKEEYQRRFGEAYNFNGGKEGALIKRLSASYDLAKLQMLAAAFFDSTDSWVSQKGGYTISVFCSQINKLVSTAARSGDHGRQHGGFVG